MNLWDVMVSIFWFMLLVAWFWLLISVIGDVFRDEELSGVAKAGWCTFVILLPWLGVLTYMIVRGKSMSERTTREAARNEQAFRSYVKDVAASEGSGGVTAELTQLAALRDQGVLTPDEYARAKERVLGSSAATATIPPQEPVATKLPV
jgi:hypothetical protein